jgi:cytochrome c551/c552
MDGPNFAALCQHFDDQKEQRELVKKIEEAISDGLGRQPNSIAPRKKKSRKQRLIRQITAEEFPGGHDQIEIGEIIKR